MDIYSSVEPLTSLQFQDIPLQASTFYLPTFIRQYNSHVMMYFSNVFVLALTSTVAAALVIERQAYNRTADCLVTSGFWGGCCPSIDPITEFGVSCQFMDGTVHRHPNIT
jgi:hypothetical protein